MSSDRIEQIDVIRGIAVLGILLMNIRTFSEPSAAYFNPLVYGDYSGLNALWWNFQAIFADQKFMAIFSMLFGASTAIICDSLQRKNLPIVSIYAKRIFILFIIGCLHAYLLWRGDILVIYALSSFVPFLFRNKPWYWAACAGTLLLAVGFLSSIAGYYSISAAPEVVIAELSAIMWHPPANEIAAEVAAYQGAYSDQFAIKIASAFNFHTEIYLAWGFWRVTGTMLLGLALFRTGFLRGEWNSKHYGLIAVFCLPAGYLLTTIGFMANSSHNWSFPASFLLDNNWNYWGSIFVAIGIMALVGFILNGTQFRTGFASLTNIGKAALSNYIFQTIMCTSIFYGYGGGLFGKLERIETAIIVIGVWATQIILSNIWFQTFTKGPLESIWSRSTYAKWSKAK